MMTSIIVDDELNNIEVLQQYLHEHLPDVQVLAHAQSVDEAKKLIQRHQPDLLFLDIQMPNKNGFDLLKELPHIDFEVIFITAFDQYGIQAIKFSALDYLLKPLDVTELIPAVHKAERRITSKKYNKGIDNLLENIKQTAPVDDPRIALPTLQETHYVNISKIVRCQAEDNYTHIWLDNGAPVLVSKTLKVFVELLSPHHFIRTHQSHLVNKKYIKSFLKEDGGVLLMLDNTRVPISRQRKESVKKYLNN